MSTGGMGGSTFTVRADTAQFTQGLHQAEQTAQRTASAISGSLVRSSQEGTRALLQMSYALDDLQYGFRAIVNNIPQMTMGLGPGVAAAAGIAAVAINQLFIHWGELSALLQGAWSGDSAAQLATLATRAEEAAKAFEKLASTPTKGQSGQTKGVGEAITEAGTEGMTQAIAAVLAKDPALQAKVKAQLPGIEGFIGAMQGKGPNMDREIGDAAYKEASKMIGGTQAAGAAGEHARLQLETKLRGLGEHGLADQVRDASPERQAQIAQKNLDLAGGRQGRKQEDKALDDAKKFGKAEADEWRKGVEEAQKHLDANKKKDRVEALEDQRTALLEQHHAQDLVFERMKAQMGHGSQTLSGPKAVSDYYQKAGLDTPVLALARAQKELQERQLKELQAVNKNLEKERRVRPG